MIATVHAHNPQQRFAVTFFRSLDAGDADEQVTTLDALADVIRSAHATHKAQLPLLSMARYGRQRTPKGSLRHAANILSVTGVEADYDQGEIDREEAALILREAGVACIIYTTPRSRFQAPRWRVLAPLSHEHPPDERGRLLARLNGVLQGIIAPESFVLSQSYYYGQTDETEGYTVEVIDGLEIDTLNELDATARWPQGRQKAEAGDRPYTKTTPSSLGFDLHSRRILTPEELTVILRLMPNGPGEETPWQDRNEWQKLGHAIAGATGHAAWAREAWIEWSAQIDGDMTEPARFWDTLGPMIRAGFSTLRRYFDAHHGEGALDRLFPETLGGDEEKSSSAPNSRLLKPAADFIAGFRPPDYLVRGLIQRRYIYSLTAPTGHGKTAIALLLTACVAQGSPFGSFQTKPGRVLYFAGENPDDVRARWIALADEMKIDAGHGDIFFMEGTGDLLALRQRIFEEAEAIEGVNLVVIDTLAAYFQGDDENVATQLGGFARELRTLTTLPGGPCVIILAHPKKDATRTNLVPRGAGAFLAEVDGNLTAWKDDMIVSLHHFGKFRGAGFDPVTLELRLVENQKLKDSDGRVIPSVVCRALSEAEYEAREAQTETAENLVLAQMKRDPEASMATIATRLGWLNLNGRPKKSTVEKAMHRLREFGFVQQRRRKWTLTKEGEREAEKISTLWG